MRRAEASDRGFSLIETVIALGVLTVGCSASRAFSLQGCSRVASSPGDLIATQKAAEAVESVFSARDSHVLSGRSSENVNGLWHRRRHLPRRPADHAPAGARRPRQHRDDDARPIETVGYPGKDQTARHRRRQDGRAHRVHTRNQIRDIKPTCARSTVTITYQAGRGARTR